MKRIITTSLLVGLSSFIFSQISFNFETWTGNEPNNWATFNSVPGLPQTTFQEVTNPGQGSSSVKLKTADCPSCSSLYLSNPLGGIISLGNDNGDLGIPFSLKPISINFKYKSKPLGGDVGGIFVQLTLWNAINSITDIIGEAWFESSINVLNWTSVTLPITYNSNLLPDTLIIEATSSIGHSLFPLPTIPNPVVGSEFYIDDINITLPSCAGFSCISFRY